MNNNNNNNNNKNLIYNLEDLEDFFNAKSYLDGVYSKYLDELTTSLNHLHKKDFSRRYWEIIIGYWLKKFINFTYAQYSYVSFDNDYLSSELSSLRYIPVSSEQYASKINLASFASQVREDIFSIIKSNKIANTDYCLSYPKISKTFLIKSKIKIFLFFIFNIIFFKLKANGVVIVSNTYFKYKNLFTLSKLLDRRLIVFNNSDRLNSIKCSYVDIRARTHLVDNFVSSNEFEDIINLLLPFHIPSSYIESFKIVKSQIPKNILKLENPIILSANSLAHDEIFKVCVSELTERKSGTLLISQHGGNSGLASIVPEDDFLRSVADNYLTWGWSDSIDLKLIPLSPSRLINHKKWDHKKTYKNKILFVGGTIPKFTVDFRFMPSQRRQYLNDQKEFAGSLSDHVLKNIVVRPYHDNIRSEILSLWPIKESQFESWDIKIIKSINDSSLFICDHLMTTFIEALVMNIPTILFSNESYPDGIIRANGKLIISKLKQAKLFYNNPKLAANFVNEIYPDGINSWWFSDEVQEARKDFCKFYANISNEPFHEWANFLNNLDKSK